MHYGNCDKPNTPLGKQQVWNDQIGHKTTHRSQTKQKKLRPHVYQQLARCSIKAFIISGAQFTAQKQMKILMAYK